MQLSPDLRIGGPFYRQTVPEEFCPVRGAGKSLPRPSNPEHCPRRRAAGESLFSGFGVLLGSVGRKTDVFRRGGETGALRFPEIPGTPENKRCKAPVCFCENKKPRNENVPRFFRLIFQNWEWVYFSSGAFFISSVSGTSEVPTAEKRTESESL